MEASRRYHPYSYHYNVNIIHIWWNVSAITTISYKMAFMEGSWTYRKPFTERHTPPWVTPSSLCGGEEGMWGMQLQSWLLSSCLLHLREVSFLVGCPMTSPQVILWAPYTPFLLRKRSLYYLNFEINEPISAISDAVKESCLDSQMPGVQACSGFQ